MTPSISLADVIAYVESKDDAYAFRFEPATYANLSNPSVASKQIIAQIQSAHNCSYQSALVIYSSSFGKYQIMGFNLFGQLKLGISAFEFMGDAGTQDKMFWHFAMQKKLDTYTPDSLAASEQARVYFGMIYNGNGNAYAQQIENALAHFGYQVKQ